MNLTPIENINGVWCKRDDKFRPFGDDGPNGGKVRQCLRLVENNLDHIWQDCGGTLVTCSSVHSPQGVIVSSVAKKFGLKSVLMFQGDQDSVKKHKTLQIAESLGCQFVYSKIGFDRQMVPQLKRLFPKSFLIKFGMNTDTEAIIDSTAYQVTNLPDMIDHLIIPSGSCITAAGILWGLMVAGKVVNNIHVVQIAGYDRQSEIRRLVLYKKATCGPDLTLRKYNFIADKTYPYSKEVNVPFDGEYLDKIYEAKAWKWAENKVRDFQNGKSCFWVVGNANRFRH